MEAHNSSNHHRISDITSCCSECDISHLKPYKRQTNTHKFPFHCVTHHTTLQPYAIQ